MSVISGEDMLAGALLWWLDDWAATAEGESRTLPSRYELVPDVVDDLLDRRYSELGHPYRLAVLVADCERRWEVEQAEREVLSMAWAWGKCSLFDSACDAPLGDALDRLERAELGMNVQRRRRR